MTSLPWQIDGQDQQLVRKILSHQTARNAAGLGSGVDMQHVFTKTETCRSERNQPAGISARDPQRQHSNEVIEVMMHAKIATKAWPVALFQHVRDWDLRIASARSRG